MKILVTGASGFVAANVLPTLARDHELVSAVRRPGSAVAGEEFVIGDINANTDWRAALRGVDAVLHLAARVHVMAQTGDPLAEHRRMNAFATRALAEQAAGKVGRFVFMSTIKANGEGTGVPYRASDTPNPTTPYGISKLEGEKALRKISERSGMQVVVLRPPLIYGPKVKGNLARIAGLVKRGIPLPLKSVRNRRTMLSVGNLTEWVELALTSAKIPAGAALLGDPRPVSTPELVTRLAEGLGLPARLVPFPPKLLLGAGKLLGRGEDVSRLIEDLEVEPSFDAFDSRPVLVDPAAALQEVGKSLREGSAQDAPVAE